MQPKDRRLATHILGAQVRIQPHKTNVTKLAFGADGPSYMTTVVKPSCGGALAWRPHHHGATADAG